MGVQNSKHTATVDISQSISTTADLIQKNSQKLNSIVKNQQYLYLDFDGVTITNTTIDQNQKIEVKNQTSGNLNAGSNAMIASQMASDLQSAVEQNSQNKPGFYSIGGLNSNDMTNVKNAMNIAVKQTMTMDNYNKVVSSVFNSQTATIHMKNTTITNSKIVQSQTIVSNVIAEALTRSVIDSANHILTQQKSNVSISQTSVNEPTGPLQDLKGLMSSKGGITSSMVCCCCCLFLLILIGFMWKNGGSNIASKAVNKMPPAIP